jgi:hypothetical protein
MVVCDFNMRFTFVLVGWLGSMHNMRVFNDAMTRYHNVLPHPPLGKHITSFTFVSHSTVQCQIFTFVSSCNHAIRKYYLVDSGYLNRLGYLAPYKGTKYHHLP